MSDPILVNELISALGLTGSAAQTKRAELEKLSNDELNKIISNCTSFKKTSPGSFSALEDSSSYKGQIFSPSFKQESFMGVDFSNTNSLNENNIEKIKPYNNVEQKQLDCFLGDFIYNSTSEGLQEITSYNNSVGWLNVTDRAVNGFKVFTGQEDRIDLQSRLTKEQQDAKKLRDTAYSKPGAFESQIERLYGIPYNHQNVENLKNTSQEFTRVTACHEKFEELKKGISEFEEIYKQEQKIETAKKLNPAAAANLKLPEVSSDTKFAQIISDFCNDDENLINQYMANISKNYSSLEEAKKHYPEILKQLKQDTENLYKEQLQGKSYQQYTNEYNSACKKVFGNKEEAKKIAKNFVENAKQQAAYTEIGLTIATSVLLPGSSAFKAGAAKLTSKLGAQTAAQSIKAAMTFGIGSAPAALSTLNAATSEEGFSPEKIAEIKEKFKNGMIYGGFGAYASGPLGNAVEKVLSKNPAAFSSVISKTMAAGTETTADVLFDRMTSDMTIKESLEQNGLMNFGMMIAGGRLNKSLSKGLQDISVKQNPDGTYTLKPQNGGNEIKINNADELAGFLIVKGTEAASDTNASAKSKIKTNEFNNISELETSFKNDGINYEVMIDNSGNKLIKVVKSNLEVLGKTFKETADYYQFDNKGKLVKSSKDFAKSKADTEYIDFLGSGATRTKVENSRAGKLFSGIPLEEGVLGNTKSYTLDSLVKDLGLNERELNDIQTSLGSLEKYPISNNIDTRKLPVLEIVKSGYSDINKLSEYAPDCWHVSEFVREYLTIPDTKLENLPFEQNEKLYKILSNLDEDVKQKCKSAGVDVDNKLKVLRGDITLNEARNLCSDEKLIQLAKTENGEINKYALDLAQKLKEYGCDNDEIPYILENSDGKYKKTSKLLQEIRNRFRHCGLKLDKGYIRIDDETLKMDRMKLQDKYGGNIFHKLEYEAYRLSDLMNLYLIDKGKYSKAFHNKDILSVMDASYGVRSLTGSYRFKYCMTQDRKDAAITSLMTTLYHSPNIEQRLAMGRYKGDMSDYIQKHANDPANEEAVALTQYLNEQPLTQDIHVTREDQLGILSNIKFDDNVTLEEVVKNPEQYADKVSNQKSLIGKSFINDRFMSTTVFADGAFGNCPVNWDFEVKKGVGSAYLDVLGLASEGEILLNKNCKITITDIDISKGIANIKATVEPSQ